MLISPVYLQEAVAIQLEEERLVKIRNVLKELPEQHHRYDRACLQSGGPLLSDTKHVNITVCNKMNL